MHSKNIKTNTMPPLHIPKVEENRKEKTKYSILLP